MPDYGKAALAQLADMAKQAGYKIQQPDFVNFIKSKAEYTDMLCWKSTNAGFSVALKGKDHTILHSFLKDAHDDFVMWNRTAYNGGTAITSICSARHLPNITRTGVWTDTYAPSYYTTEIGATFSTTVYGNKICFYTVTDDRGGIWSFLIDDAITVNISVWNATQTNQLKTIIEGLDAFSEHTVVATFMGADPDHAPTGGTARGWTSSSTGGTAGAFYVIQGIVTGTDGCEILAKDSNRDFAFSCTYNATSNLIPEHSGVGTVTQIDAPVYKLDDEIIDVTNMALWTPQKASKFELTQHFYGVIDATNIAEFHSVLTLYETGLLTNAGDFTALQNFTLGANPYGYTPMLPLAIGILDTAVTSAGHTKVNAKDNSSYVFTDSFDDTLSVCGIDATKTSLASAFTIDHPLKNNRQHESKSKKDLLWANNASTSYLKIYNQVFTNDSITTGYVYYWRSRFMSGKFDNAYSQILALISQ